MFKIIYIVLLCSFVSHAQKKEAIKLTYKATNYLDITAISYDDLYLFTDKSKSFYIKGKFSYNRRKNSPDAIYSLPNSKEANYIYITENQNFKIKSKIKRLDNFYYFEETIPIQNWKLSDEFKTIKEVKLQKATTTFRGRNYTAWCDLNTPISQGPWKFNNLPGLAYEINDDAQDFHFEWQLIKIAEPKEYNFTTYDFSKEKTINQQDYIKKLDEYYKDTVDISSTRLLEELDVEILDTTYQKIDYRKRELEKKYEWEE
ncbi:GLPGLI family protein [Paenimyroides tangerinum]|uniref:GLPGLI family protein n=1 Tax=Paenimyroides tangerinum TaxID=2488728 RepID=A0A3P3W9G4_9FLAO|nr:GLPGLI family protein [Paenimyroides tangerinum]RRJ91640.1 GLPGLI family protein [Paenimyroides tangerinum]